MVLMPALQAPAIVQEDPQPAAQVAHNQSIFLFPKFPKQNPYIWTQVVQGEVVIPAPQALPPLQDNQVQKL